MKRFIQLTMLVLCLSMISTSCSEKKKSKLEGYEWVEGKWTSEEVFVRVTPQYYQIVGDLWDEDMDLNNAEKKDFDIKIVNNEFLGDIKGFVENDGSSKVYIDEEEKALFWIYDFDQKMFLTKNDN